MVGPLVSVEALRFRYTEGDYQLRVPRFEVAPGERLALIGPSGSGKTTLLHLIAGILPVQDGKVTVLGKELERATEAGRRAFRIGRLGMIFQEFELLDYLTVRENILIPFTLAPTRELEGEVRSRLEELARRAGIHALLERRPRKLSQGERQRVAICRALITGSELLLADEPTGNLDPDTTREIVDAVFAEVDRSGSGLIWVTHDHSLLDRFDRTVDLLGMVPAS